MSGSQARFGGVMLIQALEFETDKKRVFSAGHPAPKSGGFEYRAEKGYAICAMHGRSTDYLGAVGFYARKIDMEKSDAIDGIKGKLGF